jgi:hypothetical protein
MADQNHERAVEQYNGIIDIQLTEIARLKAEVERLKLDNALSTPRHLIASQDIKTLREQVERLTGELVELEGIRSYLKWNGLQADLKDWLDWRSGKNGSEIPFPKDYLPPKQ